MSEVRKSPQKDPANVPGHDPAGTTKAYFARLKGIAPIPGPVMFDTPQADEILKHVQIFPANSPFNEDISQRPVHPNSATLVAQTDLKRAFGYNLDMCFIIVPADQKKIPMEIHNGESDPGPYPLPDNTPIEGWPAFYNRHGPKMTLEQLQRAPNVSDRHMIVVSPMDGMLYEWWQGHKTDQGWEASCEATFDMKSNVLRPDGWTSSDAAGLPLFPLAPRYAEAQAGAVNHAIRVTFSRTRKEYIYPGTHHASDLTDKKYFAMGDRLRLKADVDISKMSPHARAIAQAMKTYGLIVADNGADWLISITPDERFKGLDDLRKLKGSDFDVIVPTGPDEGPRAPKK